jgi:hypothetical protein
VFAFEVDLVTTPDGMIPPGAQRTMASRAGSTVTETDASHSVYVSEPGPEWMRSEAEPNRCSLLDGRRSGNEVT